MIKLKYLALLTAAAIVSISSAAGAEFEEDFESMATVDLNVSPWSIYTGTPVIVTGQGGNGTNVVSLGSLGSVQQHDGETLTIPVGERILVGTAEFDINIGSPPGFNSAVAIWMYAQSGQRIVSFYLQWGWGGQ